MPHCRLPDRAHAADRRDHQPDQRRPAGQDEEGRPAAQLRPRRHHRRAGAGGRPAVGPHRRRGPRRLRPGAAAGRPSAPEAAQRRGHAAPGRLDGRGAGLGGHRGGPADDRLPDEGHRAARRQHGGGGSRGAAGAAALRRPGPPTRPAARPDEPRVDQAGRPSAIAARSPARAPSW